jgi:hypothetical protein
VIQWLAFVEIALATVAGLVAVVFGLAGRKPDDVTNGAVVGVEAVLLGQLVVAISAPGFGNHPTGNVLEFYVYLVTAILLPPAAVFWGLLERSRWSTVVLGVTCLAVAIMLYRMYQIWFVQVA